MATIARAVFDHLPTNHAIAVWNRRLNFFMLSCNNAVSDRPDEAAGGCDAWISRISITRPGIFC
ncbi:MAG: hypothetical protein ACXIVE_00790, partial [Salinarimonas sp.]